MMRRTICEALVILFAGLGIALLANGISPRGLKLTRNYFPDVTVPRTDLAAGHAADIERDEPDADRAELGAGASTERNAVEARLRKRGLEQIELREVRAWFEDPQYEMELIILIDARNRRQYRQGHVPGAYLLDHFHPEDTLAEVLPAALGAERVIVYCEGGGCEDSEFASVFLRDAGVPGDRIRVYPGGLAEWREAGLPIELGERWSGIRE